MFTRTNGLFTSESVSPGHPDKACDAVSDAIVQAHFKAWNDNGAKGRPPRIAIECTLKGTEDGRSYCTLSGEITCDLFVNHEQVARDTLRGIGYTNAEFDFDPDNAEYRVDISQQSADISQGVSAGEGLHSEQGAGDQGMMFGYACDETEQHMPLSAALSHDLLRRYEKLRRDGTFNWGRPDAKSQVTVEYVDGVPTRVDTVVISVQHAGMARLEDIREALLNEVIRKVIPQELLVNTVFHVNPTGRFERGGPFGDAGLTGRKIIVDTYGGHGAHGGGAFSGKDPTKVDRSAAYFGRYIAKHLVAAGICRKALVQLSYAIGVAQPTSIIVDTLGTTLVDVPEADLDEAVMNLFDARPASIIETLGLLNPEGWSYQDTAAYGHFGRTDVEFPWERLDPTIIAALQERFGIEVSEPQKRTGTLGVISMS